MTEVPLINGHNQDNSICFISLVKDECIPPRSEVIVPIQTVDTFCKSKVGILESNPALIGKQNIIGATCLVHMKNSRACLQILNPTNSKIRLSKETKIGKFYEINENSITSEVNDNLHTVNSVSHTNEISDSEQYIQKAKQLNFDLSNSDLTPEQKHSLMVLLGQNSDVFALNLSELGCTDLFPHRIDTGNAHPIKQRCYRQSPALKQETSKHVHEMLNNNIIEPSLSEWASPVCLVQKKSTDPNKPSYRFCVDFRKLNALTEKKVFPLPKMEDIFDSLGEARAKWNSTVDMFNGYLQIKLDPKTKHKTAFTCHEGVFEFNRLPFGLSNSPHTFQLAMSEVLRGINWKSALVYMDDILIFSQTFEEHLQHLAAVFQKLREANLRLKPTKCNFAAKEVKFLGHVLSKNGIAVDTTKTDAVKSFPKPENTTDVRAFLGLANYYRKFVKGFSKIAAPLHKLLAKGAKFIWDNDCQSAFEQIKQLLTAPPVLAFPDFSKDFILYTDASQIAIGYVLGQKDSKGRERVIAYGGRALRGAEKNYGITQLEYLALVEGVKQYHVYLANRKFKIFTDHEALKNFQKIRQECSTGRLARWAMFLQGYDFEIHYKKGSAHGNADALSRRPYPAEVAVINSTIKTQDGARQTKSSN